MGVVLLHAREIGAHDGLRGIEDLLVQRLDVHFVCQFDTERLQKPGRIEFFGKLRARAVALDRECELTCNHQAHRHVVFRERISLTKVRHELADQRAIRHERNEGDGTDALTENRRL